MSSIGIRELRQNASEAVRRVASGETITVTDRGRPVARLAPPPQSVLAGLIDTGRARPPLSPLADLPPLTGSGTLGDALHALRDEERY
ncbi:type II toxin-antitoxin system Phd/YefM family antitoxin [Microbacterium sp.]|uniref:type II toxin-antitoxin system Phd/YefM family antitoxin n=1 Tax=Microbacterium sp. TaxID=51671 RepID=UPI0039E21FB4